MKANRLILEVEKLCSRVELWDDGKTRVEQTMWIINRGCKKAMPLLGTPNIRKKAVYWWDDNIAVLRRESDPTDQLLMMRVYKEAKKSLKKAITRKKNQAFQELRDDVNVNPYGLEYKIVMDKLNRRKPMEIMDERVMRNIVDRLCPTHESANERRKKTLSREFLPFSAEEHRCPMASHLR